MDVLIDNSKEIGNLVSIALFSIIIKLLCELITHYNDIHLKPIARSPVIKSNSPVSVAYHNLKIIFYKCTLSFKHYVLHTCMHAIVMEIPKSQILSLMPFNIQARKSFKNPLTYKDYMFTCNR